MISNKTKNYIVFLLESELPDVFKELPKNSKKFPNPVVDYRKMILADSLTGVGYNFSETLINFIQKQDATSVREMIYGLELKYVPDEPYEMLKNK